MADITIFIALIAGLLSFISPCILPIIPGFLGYLAGTFDPKKGPSRGEIFLNSLFYVIGFSVIFSLIGILFNGILSGASYTLETWLSRIGGTLVIILGLQFSGLINISFLSQEHEIRLDKKFKNSYLNSFLLGVIFAVGWTPCVGAVLGSVLAIAATNPGTSFLLLLFYSIGLGIPFLIAGLFLDKSRNIIRKISSKLKYYNVIVGIFLIILGILIFTQTLSLLANFSVLNDWFIGK